MPTRQIYEPAINTPSQRGWCFVADTLVSMADGTQKPIQDLKVGDKVWNYDGTAVNTVDYVFSRRKPTITSALFGVNDLTSTFDHKIPTVSRILDGFDNSLRRWTWSELEKKEIGDVNSTRRVSSKGDSQDYVLKPFVTGNEVNLTNEELEAYGFWLGDGSLSYDHRGYSGYRVTVYGGDTKKEYVDSLGVYTYRNAYSGLHTWVLNKTRHEELHRIIGKSRVAKGEKQLLLIFTPTQYKYIIKGYLAADGSKSSYNHTSATISHYLATSLAMAGNAAGYQVGLQKLAQKTEQIILGRVVKCAPYVYYQSWTELDKLQSRSQQIKRRSPNDNFTLTKKKGHIDSGEKIVYNIQTSGDHSYIANGIGVFNCLKYVDDAGNAPNRTSTAQIAYNNERNAGRINTGSMPVGIWVVAFMSFTTGQYTQYGHVGFAKKHAPGRIEIHDSEVNAGARGPYWSIEEWLAWFGAMRPSYDGFSYACDGRTYAEDYSDALPPTERMVLPGGVNFRNGASTGAGIVSTIAEGLTVDFKGWTRGENVNGNDIWFVSSRSGLYAWSGGFTDSGTHDLPNLTPTTPEPPKPVDPPKYTFTKDLSCVTEVIPAGTDNFEYGNFPAKPEKVVIHDFGTKGVDTYQSVVNTFSRNTGRVASSHFVVSGKKITQVVSLKDRAYHAGPAGNGFIGIETDPAQDADTIASTRTLLTELKSHYGYQFPLIEHNQIMATKCGDDVDLNAYDITPVVEPEPEKPIDKPVEPEKPVDGKETLFDVIKSWVDKLITWLKSYRKDK